jgi:hypothetical protein
MEKKKEKAPVTHSLYQNGSPYAKKKRCKRAWPCRRFPAGVMLSRERRSGSKSTKQLGEKAVPGWWDAAGSV